MPLQRIRNTRLRNCRSLVAIGTRTLPHTPPPSRVMTDHCYRGPATGEAINYPPLIPISPAQVPNHNLQHRGSYLPSPEPGSERSDCRKGSLIAASRVPAYDWTTPTLSVPPVTTPKMVSYAITPGPSWTPTIRRIAVSDSDAMRELHLELRGFYSDGGV